jgi:hypothetical protein
MDDSPSGTFPNASISAKHPQEWMILTNSRYFVISRFQMLRVPYLQDSKTQKADMSMGSQSLPCVPTVGWLKSNLRISQLAIV